MAAGYSRRKFLGTTAKALITAGAFTALPKELQAQIIENNEGEVFEKGFSILQGLTTETTTQLSVDVPKDFSVHYRLVDFDRGRAIHPTRTSRTTRDHSSWAVDQVAFDGLELGILYLFQVLDENGNILDERELHAVDLSNKDARIAVMSCMMDFNLFKGCWKNVEDAEPDYCFFIGDNVYGDVGGVVHGPKLLWRRYIETRRSIPFYRKRRLTPVLALWDDHDYGKNNSNHRYKHKENSLDIFNSFFPRAAVEGVFVRGPGVSSLFRAFGHDFVFIDNRYFRDKRSGGTKSFWGLEQLNWVKAQIAQSNYPKWILQGSQFFGHYQGKGQSFEGGSYEAEFDSVMKMLRDTNLPSVFVSGDVHFSEVMMIEREKTGYRSYELTASHMHSFTAKAKSGNPRRKQLVQDANFLIVDLINSSYGALYQVRSIGRSGDLAFRDFLQVF